MATITIRNLPEETKRRLRRLAAERGHSMEEEARRILSRAVESPGEKGLGTLINRHFAELGGVELELPARSPVRPSPPLPDSPA